jgi:hypothetical protein
MQRHLQFLYDPASAAGELALRPELGRQVSPAAEGQKAEWFPGLRKSPRQLYRLLGNTQYAHLATLLDRLDVCMGAGFDQPRLLRTRTRSSFAPDLAELHAADHFVLGGCSLQSFDASKGDESVADFVASRKSVRVAVEVYCPLTWEHLEEFESEVMAVVKNIDMPFDFEFTVDFEKIEEFTPEGNAAFLHPGVLDEALAADARGKAIIAELEEELPARLNDEPDWIEINRLEENINLRLRLTLTAIAYSRDRLPVRSGCIRGPERSGYRPEGIFESIVGNVIAKAKRGQALTVADVDAAVLVVHLGAADLFSELRNETYRSKIFLPILQQRIGEERYGHTTILFCDSAGWGKPFTPWFASYDDATPAALLDLLDPRRVLCR